MMNPCIQAIGPKPNKMMLLGEAPGAQEEKFGIPFIGPAGKELDRLLEEAGLSSPTLYKTNVFHTRPANNRLSTLFITSQEAKKEPGPFPPITLDGRKMYLHPELVGEMDRLAAEIQEVNPNLIVALGNTALWALTGRGNISSVRGTTLLSAWPSPRKLLPTYHPSAILHQWELRAITVADLMKAKVQAEFPEINRPKRLIEINPTLTDLVAFIAALGDYEFLAVDVETRNGQITEIGFASSATYALVVPFVRGHNAHYWASPQEEVQALQLVKCILQSSVPKILQNGAYDIQYIIRTWKFYPRNVLHDTMIRHHSLYPELQKGLGFLGSLYTDEPSWKLMRNKKDTVEKRDDE